MKRRLQNFYSFFTEVRLAMRKFNRATDAVEKTVIIDEINSLVNKRIASGSGFNEVWPDKMKLVRIRLPLAGSSQSTFQGTAPFSFAPPLSCPPLCRLPYKTLCFFSFV